MVKALVAGAGGFIGHHLVRYLKSQGYWVRAVDVKIPEFGPSEANQFLILDLRNPIHCNAALSLEGGFDEVYQLAADMEALGATTVVVSEGSVPQTERGYCLSLDSGLDELLAVPLQLPLFQYLACYTAMRIGYDPDNPKNLTHYVQIEVS